MRRPAIIVCGKVFDPTFGGRIHGTHRFESKTFPPRWVVKGPVGWNRCDACLREHRIWMCTDATWQLLPPMYRKLRLCVRCFRRRLR